MGGKNGKGKKFDERKAARNNKGASERFVEGVDRENIFPDISELFPREGCPARRR